MSELARGINIYCSSFGRMKIYKGTRHGDIDIY